MNDAPWIPPQPMPMPMPAPDSAYSTIEARIALLRSALHSVKNLEHDLVNAKAEAHEAKLALLESLDCLEL